MERPHCVVVLVSWQARMGTEYTISDVVEQDHSIVLSPLLLCLQLRLQQAEILKLMAVDSGVLSVSVLFANPVTYIIFL